MKKKISNGKTIFFVFLLTAILSSLGCKSRSGINEPMNNNEDHSFYPTWTNNIPLTSPAVSDFAHDNRIYETEHFLVYSDAASESNIIQFGEMAEKSFAELKVFFMLPANENFKIQRENASTKIQIICNQNDPRSQRSFFFGFMLYDLDSPYCFATEENLYREIKHELTHVFQMFMDGSSRRYEFGWFREGLAEFAADGGFFQQINTLSYFNELKFLLNEYKMHALKIRWSQLKDIPGEVHAAAYSMSGLAMRYLLDPAGSGKSISEIKQIFHKLKQNDSLPFQDAFKKTLGIDIHDFEDRFYEVMPCYLRSTEKVKKVQ